MAQRGVRANGASTTHRLYAGTDWALLRLLQIGHRAAVPAPAGPRYSPRGYSLRPGTRGSPLSEWLNLQSKVKYVSNGPGMAGGWLAIKLGL